MKKPRGILIAGNWKMNLGQAETRAFFMTLGDSWSTTTSEATEQAIQSGRLQAWVFAPFLSLSTACEMSANLTLGNSPAGVLRIGAQNVHWERAGAFTGEVSGPMLHEAGVEHALVGHSERRQFFGETDETARKRTESLLQQGFQVILCVGETRLERENGQTENVLKRQLEGALSAEVSTQNLILAYEPVWAIGTGLTASAEQAEEAHRFIRAWLQMRFGEATRDRLQILYGGSVNPENIAGLLACPNIDGALVGGASVKPLSYLALLEAGGQAAAELG